MTHTMILLAQAQNQSPPIGGGGEWLVWGVVLLAVALALFVVEVFLPTGGIVGGLSGAAAVAGVVMFFRVDTTLGVISASACLLALPFLMAFALKIWPDTPFGKWVTLEHQQKPISQRNADLAEGGDQAANQPQGEGEERAAKIAVGDAGQTLTPLFPVGTCLIHGRREECLAKHGTIPAGTAVRVVVVDGSEVYVAPAES